ncbi:Solute carrier family 23 member 1 [Merluccius polli]|uniref:Solute carrier family 23 member 1 n=1 Tax=Merluccius polli TaxID=89951 RepID=A0AA47NPS2_MERPO|nr:Solute carrier family 23 member 1 [Merluccius polli]
MRIPGHVDSIEDIYQTLWTENIKTQELEEESDTGYCDLLPQKEDEISDCSTEDNKLAYCVTDVPPWYLCIILGIQHCLTAFGGIIAIPLILSQGLCLQHDSLTQSHLISTIFFVSGVCTLLQVTFGVRLPILQGGTFTLLAPSMAMLSMPEWTCPAWTQNATLVNTSSPVFIEVWQSRMRAVTRPFSCASAGERSGSTHYLAYGEKTLGSIMVGSLFQVLVGFSGLIGLFMRFVGPLTIAPTISLIGLSLFDSAGASAGNHWGISSMTIVLIVLFSQYLRHIAVPFPTYSKQKKLHTTRIYIFQILPVLLGITLSWLICYILTVSDVLPSDPHTYGNAARTDLKGDVIGKAPWVTFPYPVLTYPLPSRGFAFCRAAIANKNELNLGVTLKYFGATEIPSSPVYEHNPCRRDLSFFFHMDPTAGQWGLPTVSLAGVFGILAGVISSMIESVGDYHACARLSGAPPPPKHAINRGIGIEGLGCLLAGAWGTGNGTTSYSENVGALGITKVGSRMVIVAGGVLMVVMGVFGKIGAIFTTIPTPVVGGMFLVMFGVITAAGVSNLQYTDMNSSRNIFIFGFSMFSGLVIPNWIMKNPNTIATGLVEFDQVVQVLLTTSMFVGGFFGFFLDNTIPGSKAERGIVAWNRAHQEDSSNTLESEEVYGLPFGISSFFQSYSWSRYIPFCPPRTPGILDGYDGKTDSKDIKLPPDDPDFTQIILVTSL